MAELPTTPVHVPSSTTTNIPQLPTVVSSDDGTVDYKTLWLQSTGHLRTNNSNNQQNHNTLSYTIIDQEQAQLRQEVTPNYS